MTAVGQDFGRSRSPVLACTATIAQALKDVAGVPVEFLPVGEKAAALLELAAIDDLVASLRLRVLVASDDLAAEDGARDPASWLAHHARTDLGPQQRDLHLAEALRRWTRVGEALAGGGVNRVQAQVIVNALDALPPDVDADILVRAEEHLIELAQTFAPKQLRVLGRKVLDVLAPEVGEAHEARALEDEERRAHEVATLTFRSLGNGRTRIDAIVPDLTAHRLRTYLEAFTSPRHDAVAGAEAERVGAERISAERKRGQAFCTLLEAVDPKRLPLHGGDATTVFVTVTLDALRSELATAGLITADDDQISASEARRLACTAKLIPTVLGGASEVLDLGRSARLFSPAQRKALRLRDKCCRAEGCTVAATWTEAHHRDPWVPQGVTDLANGILLCSHHHHRAHDARYELTDRPNGDVAFHRRT